ncbi:MAG: ComEC/Rec2 family competence protein [Hyphomicrobiaceae bacterium]|nr:ComEC/Rec2 family competence protein [Hyphomicrobiaceae bacterium]
MGQQASVDASRAAGDAIPASGIVPLDARPLGAGGLLEALEHERARWFYWVPVAFGCGIWSYFALSREPPFATTLLPFFAAMILHAALRRAPAMSIATTLAMIMAAGFAMASIRSATVAAPILEKSIGPVEVRGFVELVEPREDRGERLTLRVTALGAVPPEVRPERVRVRTPTRMAGLEPGDAVIVRARLAPPAAPALPGDYDFARHAYFQGLGAVGYAVAPPRRDADASSPPLSLAVRAAIERFRQSIGRRVTAVLPGPTGAIANALMTGERGGIPEATNEAFRDSGLFHILSISGLHMAIMGGAVFWTARAVLALFPSIALRYPIKKWAAVAAAFGSLGYLAISGGSFATVRSFITISIMFLAILMDRPAVALRNVALSAFAILILFPESLLDVGFQMSFAAVVALVSAYEMFRDRARRRGGAPYGALTKVALFFGGIVLSTLVASAAVAPFAIYHFHTSQQFAILANLLAVPLCNIVVMPAALAAFLAMPLGLEAGPLLVMGMGIEGMVWTADHVAALPGAVTAVSAIPTFAFVLMLAGGLWLLLWGARWRLLGGVALVAGIVAAPLLERPDVLVGRDGRLVAVRGISGALSVIAEDRSRFEVARWLEHDGDDRDAKAAAVNGGNGVTCDSIGCTATVKGMRISVARHPAAIAEDCARADILVLDVPVPKGCESPAAIVDFFAARTKGTHAIYIERPRGIRIETVAERRGIRPWAPAHPWSNEGRKRARELALRARKTAAASRGWAPDDAPSRLPAFAAPVDMLDTLVLPRADDEDDLPLFYSDDN